MRTTDRALQDIITFVAVAALALVGLLLPSVANAAAGDLDPGFGDAGKLEPGRSGPSAVEVDSQGRYLLGTGGSIIAFDGAGNIETSFGANGTALGGPFFEIDSQGRIVSGRHDGTIVRVDADGDLDTGFGDSGHVHTSSIGGLAVQPDDSVVVSGRTANHLGITIRRFQEDGDPDTSFGTNGVATFFPPDRPGSISVTGRDLAVTPDGSIVATGKIDYPRVDFPGNVVVKVTSDGVPDPQFGGGDGMVLSTNGANDPRDVELLSGGRLLITGTWGIGSWSFGTSVLQPNGEMDENFGAQGVGAVDWGFDTTGQCSPTRVWDAELDSDGRILLVGAVGQRSSCSSDSPSDVSFFGVARLLPNGSLDTSFGNQGKAGLEFSSAPLVFHPPLASPRGASVALDQSGRILFAGQTQAQQGMALARLEGGDGDGNGEGDGGGIDEGEGGVAGGVAGKLGLKVHRVVVPKSIKGLIRRGVRVLASCDQHCKIVVKVDVSDEVASRLGLSRTRIARGRASAGANKRRWVNARLSTAAARAFDDFGGGGRLQIRVRATGPGAQSATVAVAG